MHYGVKIRAPHALVMTFLFKGDQPIRKNIEGILKVSQSDPLKLDLPQHTFYHHVGHSSTAWTFVWHSFVPWKETE